MHGGEQSHSWWPQYVSPFVSSNSAFTLLPKSQASPYPKRGQMPLGGDLVTISGSSSPPSLAEVLPS